ncbi:MAG: FIST C-terminal domain-containing protein [Chitinophagaceae bacterium]|nr:FIST C-terminal domain-containing protein [Chitinophagaceae bacterium]
MSDGFRPTLAIVFISIKQDTDYVCSLLHEKNIQVFGSTTAGEFINSEILQGAITIMLLDLNPDHFKIVFSETSESSAYDSAKKLGTDGKWLFANPAFMIASGWLHTDGEEIMRGIQEGAGNDAPVFGGMAGDDLLLRQPIVFTYGRKSVTGLVAIVINEDRIAMKGVATCGWKPIGIRKVVTKSVGNIIYTIDDQPALDLVIKYLGLNIDLNPGTDIVTNIGAYYPLQLERENSAPVMRTAMLGNKEDRSLICAGTVPQGAKVRFSLPPDFDVIDTVVSECMELKNEQQSEADAMIIFSCISRYLSFGVMTSEEIERVAQVWNAPLIGFFCYGEFGKSLSDKRTGQIGRHEFHNNTCCVVVLKEKK